MKRKINLADVLVEYLHDHRDEPGCRDRPGVPYRGADVEFGADQVKLPGVPGWIKTAPGLTKIVAENGVPKWVIVTPHERGGWDVSLEYLEH